MEQEQSATSTDELRSNRKRTKSNHSNCEHKVRVRNGTYETLKNLSGEEKIAMSAIIDQLVQERQLRGKRDGELDAIKGDIGGYGGYGGDGGNGRGGGSVDLGTTQLRAYVGQLQQQVSGLEDRLAQTIKHQQDLATALSHMQFKMDQLLPAAGAYSDGGMEVGGGYAPGSHRSNSGALGRTAPGDRPSAKSGAGFGPAGGLDTWSTLLLKQRGLSASGAGTGGIGMGFNRDVSSLVCTGHRSNMLGNSIGGHDGQGLLAGFASAGLDTSQLAMLGGGGSSKQDMLSVAVASSQALVSPHQAHSADVQTASGGLRSPDVGMER